MDAFRWGGAITLEMDVKGVPTPQGSTKSFVRGGKPIITTDNKGLKAWRDLVAFTAQDADPEYVDNGPVRVSLFFRMPKPKAEPKTKRTWPDRRPDLDKLIRAILDALTGIAFRDDGQVVGIHAEEDWGEPGVRIEVERLTE